MFGNDKSDSSSGHKDSFVLEQPIRPDDSIRIDGKLPGEVADGGNHFFGADGTGGNGKFDLHSNLLKNGLRQTGVDFYKHDFSSFDNTFLLF